MKPIKLPNFKLRFKKKNPSTTGTILILALAGIAAYALGMAGRKKNNVSCGIRYSADCSTFTTVNLNAYAKCMGAVREEIFAEVGRSPKDAEAIFSIFYSRVLPKCTWPPTKPITIDGVSWTDAITMFKNMLTAMEKGLEAAPAPYPFMQPFM